MAHRESGLKYGEDLRADYLIVRRPHFHLREGALCFLASEPPTRILSERELKLWNLMDQPLSVDAARKACGEGAETSIRELLRSELCELVEPVFPDNRRRVLVIEPHADDAALSVGGLIWLRRRECEFIVATMASRSNHTSYYDKGVDYFDIREVSEIRRRESELFARMIGGSHVPVGMTDAPLRYRDAQWTLDYFARHRMSIDVRLSRMADDRELNVWAEAVRRLLTDIPSAEVWIPLGGPHTDHMLTADACFAAFLSNPSLVEGRVLRVYEEVPYAARNPSHMNGALAALRKAGALWDEELVSIDEAYDQKLRLSSVYASQNIGQMRADVEASARAHPSEFGHAELLRTLRRLPDRIDPAGIVSAVLVGHDQDEEIVAWISKHSEVNRVRILLHMPTGRWAADLEMLCRTFPKAKFELYVASVAAAEVNDSASDRVEVRRVAEGALPWVSLSLKLCAAMKPLPTLFCVSEERVSEARLLSKLWLGSDTLIVASMDRLKGALPKPYEPPIDHSGRISEHLAG
jgi:LmbE family N-acetylglucosaminyl deacetylase